MNKDIWKILEDIGDEFEPVDKETNIRILPEPDADSPEEDIIIYLLEKYYTDERGESIVNIEIETRGMVEVTLASGNVESVRVLTDDEADEEALEYLRDVHFEDGTGVNLNNNLINNFLNHDYLNRAMEDDLNDYFYHNMDAGELIEWAVWWGDIDDGDERFFEENGDVRDDIKGGDYQELAEAMIENRMNDAGSGEDYFRDMLGDEEFKNFVIDRDLVDWDAYFAEIIDQDGRGPYINNYDGEENHLGHFHGEDYYIYLMDRN